MTQQATDWLLLRCFCMPPRFSKKGFLGFKPPGQDKIMQFFCLSCYINLKSPQSPTKPQPPYQLKPTSKLKLRTFPCWRQWKNCKQHWEPRGLGFGGLGLLQGLHPLLHSVVTSSKSTVHPCFHSVSRPMAAPRLPSLGC